MLGGASWHATRSLARSQLLALDSLPTITSLKHYKQSSLHCEHSTRGVKIVCTGMLQLFCYRVSPASAATAITLQSSS